MRWIVSGLVVVAAALNLSAPAQADTEITQPGFVINQPGEYELDADLNFSNSPFTPAIRILNTQNVKLKLKGHRITGRAAPGGGRGIGILIQNCRDVEIDGNDDSQIRLCQEGIRVVNSRDILIDGDDLQLRSNRIGLFASGTRELRVDDVRGFGNGRDMYVNQCPGPRISGCRFLGSTQQAVLISNCSGAQVIGTRIGEPGNVNVGVFLFNSANATVQSCRLNNAQVGVMLNGDGTTGARIRSSRFQGNQLDVRYAFGAQPPQLSGNQPNNLNVQGN